MTNPIGPLPCKLVTVSNRIGLIAQWIGFSHMFLVGVSLLSIALVGAGFLLLSVVGALSISLGTTHD